MALRLQLHPKGLRYDGSSKNSLPARSRATARAVVLSRASRHGHQKDTQIATTSSSFQNTMKSVLIALAITASTQAVLLHPLAVGVAHADDEEESSQYMSPYEKRQADLKKRREMLQKLRDDALSKASSVVESAPSEPVATPEASPAEEAQPFSFSSPLSYDKAVQSAPSLKKAEPPAPEAPEPPAPPAPVSSPFKGFFSKPEEPAAEEKKLAAAAEKPSSDVKPWWEKLSDPAAVTETPAPPPVVPSPPAPPAPPAPPPVVPAPAPPTPKPAPRFEAKKEEPVKAPEPAKVETKPVEVKKTDAKPGKRKGPLPLWFAELMLLGVYAAIGLAATKYNEQSTKALAFVGGAVQKVGAKLEEVTAKK